MSKLTIYQAYQACDMGYDTAVLKLKRLGMNEVQADAYLVANRLLSDCFKQVQS